MNKLIAIWVSLILSGLWLANLSITHAQTPDNEVISTVDNVDITVTSFQDRYRVEKWLFAFQVQRALVLSDGNTQQASMLLTHLPIPQHYTNRPDTRPDDALLFLEDEEAFALPILENLEAQALLEQLAIEQGIVVNDADVQAVLDEFMLNWSGVDLIDNLSEDDKQQLLTEFRIEFYESALQNVGADQSAVDDMFYHRALRSKFRADIGASIPTETIWIESRHIQITPDSVQIFDRAIFDPAICQTEAWQAAKLEADEVYNQLQSGASFADLAQAVSDDTGSGSAGGALGWAEAEVYVRPFADAVISVEIDAITEPVCSEFGWHIIDVLNRELRPVQDTILLSRQEEIYQQWEHTSLRDADVHRINNWFDYIPADPSYEDIWDAMFAGLVP